MVVPEHARTDDDPRILWEIGPPIVVDIGALLSVGAREQRQAPLRGQRRGIPQAHIRGATRRAVDQELTFRFRSRAPRDQIDDAAHRTSSVQRRRHAFDHFRPAQVERWDLHEPERHLFAEQRQPVRQEPCVPPAHTLDTHARRPERRRRRLHAHPAHLVQHHDDVARRHHQFLVDLFGVEHFHTHGLILESAVRPRRGHGHRFLNGGKPLELDRDRLLLPGGNRDRSRHWRESCLDDRELDETWSDVDPRFAARVGHVRSASYDNLGADHRRTAGDDRADHC